uniref:Uncharacterized protein MANES_15G143000 n=1 Tax=Rhizophora mucronata TaxID=61149 RepID=A0A2P2K0S0_RHIMU
MERWRGLRTRLGGEVLRSERMIRAIGVVSKKESLGKRDATSNDNDDDSNSSNVTSGEERKAEADKNPGGGNHGGPPLDDCCPICFGTFTVPCKANCGHWYCGSSFLFSFYLFLGRYSLLS